MNIDLSPDPLGPDHPLMLRSLFLLRVRSRTDLDPETLRWAIAESQALRQGIVVYRRVFPEVCRIREELAALRQRNGACRKKVRRLSHALAALNRQVETIHGHLARTAELPPQLRV